MGHWGGYQFCLNKAQLARGCPHGAPRGHLARCVSSECLQFMAVQRVCFQALATQEAHEDQQVLSQSIDLSTCAETDALRGSEGWGEG